MIEVKNQFAAHGIFWMLSLPFVTLLALPALMSASSFVVSPQEVGFFAHVLMRDVKAVEIRADSWFKAIFEDTHITTMVRDFFNPAKSSGMSPLASRTMSLGQNYNNGVWLMVYRGLYRIAGLWPVVLAVFLSLGIPCLFDGLAVRARKAYNFQFHNPVFFWSAGHLLILVMGLGVFLPFLPIALSSTILIGFFGLFCTAIWITAANFQTGN